jgi:hypothetical protein
LKDGAGTNTLARIDNQNRLHTSSVDITENAHTSIHDQQCFSVIGTTLITNVEKTVLILINNPTSADTIALSLLRISLQGETGKPVTFKAYLGRSTYSSGGTVRIPVNVYANSTVILDVAAYSDNPVLGGSDTQFQQAFEEATTTLDAELDGAVILPPNSSLRITVMGDALASGTKTAFVRLLYYAIDEVIHQ